MYTGRGPDDYRYCQPSSNFDRRYLTINDAYEAQSCQQLRSSDGEQQLSHLCGYRSDNGEPGRRDALDQEQHRRSRHHRNRERSVSDISEREKMGRYRPHGPELRGDHDLTMFAPLLIGNHVPLASTDYHDLGRLCLRDNLSNCPSERWSDNLSDRSRSAGEHESTAQNSLPRSIDTRKFGYRRLGGPKEFRLVELLPRRTYKLKCKIKHCSLINHPKYVAISYAWGDGFDKKRITLEDDDDFMVHASLHDALMAVRDGDNPVLLWIDGLCIDQKDNTERALQVQLMDQIYAKATFVAIWLGPEMDESERAISMLEKLEELRSKRGETGVSEWIESVDYDGRASLRSLFKRDYWKRLWVVQEIYHARSKVIYCGSSKLPWDLHKRASDALWRHESDPYLRTGPSSFPDVEHLMNLGPDSLLEVLRACRRKLSENPRDKIFGVLGLLPDDIREHLHVRYDKSIKTLYLDVIQLIIPSTHRLDVIREAIHFPPQVSSTDLPTWCPDWAQVPETSALSGKDYSAAGNTNAKCDFKDEFRKLEVSAIELSVIGTTGVAVGTLCALQDYLMAFLNWRALLLSFFAVDKDQETMHPRVFDFCFTLSLGHLVEGWQDHWTEACYQVFSSLTQERLPRLELDHNFRRHRESRMVAQSDQRSFIQNYFGNRMMGRAFCITRDGLIGMGTGSMRRGDVVVVPFGCSTPILLRAEGQSDEFRYIEDVYIHGYMHGEALTSGKLVKKYTLH